MTKEQKEIIVSLLKEDLTDHIRAGEVCHSAFRFPGVFSYTVRTSFIEVVEDVLRCRKSDPDPIEENN